MSSTTPPDGSQHSVYCACPGSILPRSLLRRVDERSGPRSDDRGLAEVGYVEDADGLPDRRVLFEDTSAGVFQRHVPTGEFRKFRTECDVSFVQG
jgi:hypothetical protein